MPSYMRHDTMIDSLTGVMENFSITVEISLFSITREFSTDLCRMEISLVMENLREISTHRDIYTDAKLETDTLRSPALIEVHTTYRDIYIH